MLKNSTRDFEGIISRCHRTLINWALWTCDCLRDWYQYYCLVTIPLHGGWGGLCHLLLSTVSLLPKQKVSSPFFFKSCSHDKTFSFISRSRVVSNHMQSLFSQILTGWSCWFAMRMKVFMLIHTGGSPKMWFYSGERCLHQLVCVLRESKVTYNVGGDNELWGWNASTLVFR